MKINYWKVLGLVLLLQGCGLSRQVVQPVSGVSEDPLYTPSWKHAQLQGFRVKEDLAQNHELQVIKKLIQSVNERVGKILIDKEQE